VAIEKIDYDLCNGCGICVNSCWADIIRMNKEIKKAVIKYPDNCVVCNFCALDCPQHAIVVTPTKEPTPLSLWG
jgi:NAD-dependent dihydropyrimidine dehydrogenase PreA subunit